MSSKDTIFLTNDYNEEAYFDSNESTKSKEGLQKEAISIEFDKGNIRIDENSESYLCITITNVDSELYKIFERLREVVPKHLK